MDRISWYLIACCGLCLFIFLLWILKFRWPNLRNSFTKGFIYALLTKRGRYWDSFTRLEACLLLAFFLANIVMIFVPFAGIDLRQIEKRCASLAVVNMIPLFVVGRIGPVIEALNVHRSTWGHFHHWVGRFAVLEAMLHATIVLVLKPKSSSLVTSGYLVSP